MVDRTVMALERQGFMPAPQAFEARDSTHAFIGVPTRPVNLDLSGRITGLIASRPTESTALESMSLALLSMGADQGVFVTYARDAIQREAFRFMLFCDQRLCVEVENVSTFAQHPWLTYALGHSAPICSSALTLTSDVQRRCLEVAKPYGFVSTLVVPAHAARPGGRVGVLCLGSKIEGYFESDATVAVRVAARALAGELNDWWCKREAQELCDSCDLSEVDLQLLDDTARGLGTKEICRARGLSKQSVDSRFQRLIARLGVTSRREAARLLYSHSLINTSC